jgi:hypothetical protein
MCKIPIQCIGKNMLHIKNNSLLFTKEDSVVSIGSYGGSHYPKQKVTSGLCSVMHGACVDIFLKSVGTDFAYFALG